MSTHNFNVTVIIPCHNESRIINKKIENTLKLKEYLREIIIVDDHSTDQTFSISNNISKKYKNIKVIRNNYEKGKNSAVILALKKAKGDIICMTDADIRLDEKILEKVIPYFQNEIIGVISLSPKLHVKNEQTKSYTNIYEIFIRYIKQIESRIDSVTAPHGQALFFRKSIGVLPKTQADDVDISIQSRKKGYKTIYLSNYFFHENVLNNEKELQLQKIRRCKAIINTLLFHKDVFFNSKYGLFGIICYPLNFTIYVLSPIILIITLLSITTTLFYFNKIISFIFILIILISLTKLRSIINLSYVNLIAIINYIKEGGSREWKPPRNY